MDTSLNAYHRELNRALKRDAKFANFNKDMNHAAIVVCTAFRHASKHVKLLSHQLDPVLYGSDWFLKELSGFLNRGGKLDILVESDVPREHPVMLEAKQRANVTVKRIPDPEGYEFNFMVVDDKGFRFEKDRQSTEASVVFNYDEEEVFLDARKFLTEWFDTRFDNIQQKIA